MFNANDQSWSCTRFNRFKFCERSYYYYYFASQKGWLNYDSTDEQKAAYTLKRVISFETWVKSIFNKSLKKIFFTTGIISTEKFIKIFSNQLYKSYYHDRMTLNEQNFNNELKPLIIDDLFCKKTNLGSLLAKLERTLQALNLIVKDSDISVLLSSIPVNAKKQILKPVYFYLNDIKVWNAPLLSWLSNGQINTLNTNIRFSEKNNIDWSLQGGINALYWNNTLKLPFNKVNIMTLFIDIFDKSTYIVHHKRSQQELSKIITRSFRLMNCRKSLSGQVFRENFSKTTDTAKCAVCNFRTLCDKT